MVLKLEYQFKKQIHSIIHDWEGLRFTGPGPRTRRFEKWEHTKTKFGIDKEVKCF
jgi:hypothetical protein